MPPPLGWPSDRMGPMPKFAANLSMMFQEVPFLDRFEAAAKAGFKAVEFLFPYEYPANDLAERLRRFDLKQALFNLPPGDWAKGECGISAIPGREQEFARTVDSAIEYARSLACPQVHAMAGILPRGVPHQAWERTYVRNLRGAAAKLAP